MSKYNVKYEFEFEYEAESPEQAVELFFEYVYDCLLDSHGLDQYIEVIEL